MDKVEEFKELFYQDRLSLAYARLAEIPAELKANLPEATLLQEDFADADRCLELLADLESWTPVYEEEDIAVYAQDSQNEFILRAEMIVNQPMFPVLALISEIDLVTSWVQSVKESELLTSASNFRRLTYYRLDLPWPASDRDMVVKAVGIPIPENNSILLVLKSINTPSYLGMELPPCKAGDVRIDLKLGCLNLMTHDDCTQLSFIAQIDPKLQMIPATLIDFCTKQVVFYFMKSIRDNSKLYQGSEFERRVNSKPEYYQKIQDILTEFK